MWEGMMLLSWSVLLTGIVPLLSRVTTALFTHVNTSERCLHTTILCFLLTAKLTAKPVDNSGFPWMGVDMRLASGAGGRHRWMVGDG